MNAAANAVTAAHAAASGAESASLALERPQTEVRENQRRTAPDPSDDDMFLLGKYGFLQPSKASLRSIFVEPFL